MAKDTCLICSQCGTVDINLIDESFAKCNRCGAHLKIDKTDNIKSTIEIKYSEESNKEIKPQIGFCKIKENYDISDFTRTAYVDLFTSSVTDKICDAQFLPATKKQKNYLLINGAYELNYSASIGYDRIEKYMGFEKKLQSDGRFREELVEKQRTITDWRPTSGVYNDKNNAVLETGQKYEDKYRNYILQDRFKKNILSDNSSLEPLPDESESNSPFEISQSDLKKAYNWGASIASNKCKNDLGGDKIKDFSYTYKENPKAILGIISNELTLPYKVGEVNYSVTSFSNKIITHCDGPKDDLENNVTRKNYKKSKKTLFIPPIALFLVFYLAMFIGIISANIDATSAALGAVIGLIIMCFPMGCAFVFWQMIHDKAWEKISKKEVDIINYQREEKKYKHLTKLLKEMNFKPLSEEEISRFSHLNKDGAKMNLFEKFLLWLANLSFKKK